MRRHGQDPTIQTKACSFLALRMFTAGHSGTWEWGAMASRHSRKSSIFSQAGHVKLACKADALGAPLSLQRPLEAEQGAEPCCSEAMCQHASDVELQIAALEALAKYLDKTKCVGALVLFQSQLPASNWQTCSRGI